MADSVFTNNEIAIFKAWLLDKKIKQIAEELKVSEAYVSQTLSKIQGKIGTLEKSVSLLEEFGVIDTSGPLKLTEDGKKSFQKRRADVRAKIIGLEKSPQSEQFVFTADSLKKSVSELVSAIIDPKKNETLNQLSGKIGFPLEVIKEAKQILEKGYESRISHIPFTSKGVMMTPFRVYTDRKEEETFVDIVQRGSDTVFGEMEKNYLFRSIWNEEFTIGKRFQKGTAVVVPALAGIIENELYSNAVFGSTMQLRTVSGHKHKSVIGVGNLHELAE